MPTTITMVDRASPPTAAEVTMLKNNGVTAVAGYVGGINNGGRAWKRADADRMRAAGFSFLPIYVGENVCPGCKAPVTLTFTQGVTDAVDAIDCAKAFGCNDGPLALDIEYGTYTSDVAGALAYMEAWARRVSAAGYLPVQYAITQTASDYQPTVPTGLWIANWDGKGDLAKFPNASRFTGIGWQFNDNWNGFDISHVDGAWWQAALESAPAPAAPTEYVDPVTGFKIVRGMLARWNQVSAALSTISTDEILLVVGRPVENETLQPDGSVEQAFEHCRWRWRKGSSPERFDILADIVFPFVAP